MFKSLCIMYSEEVYYNRRDVYSVNNTACHPDHHTAEKRLQLMSGATER